MTTTFETSEKRRQLLEALLRKEGVAVPSRPSIPRRAGSGPAPLSFGQQRLWFLHQLDPESAAYNISEGVSLDGPLDIAALERTLAEVVRRHESLRTVFPARDGDPVQTVIEPGPAMSPMSPMVPRIDLTGIPEGLCPTEAARIGAALAGRPFDLARGPLLRAALLRIAPERRVLFLQMHHIASDGWSMGVLVRELTTLYAAFAAGRPSPLPELPIQYPDYAEWQRGRLQGEVLDSHLRYWKERLAGAPTLLELPTDRPRPAVQTSRGSRETLRVDRAVSDALRDLAQRRGATLTMALAAAVAVLLHRHTGQDDLLIGTPAANRDRPETEGLIGFFVNTLILRADLGGDPSFVELLARFRETVLGADAHQELPFEELVDALELPRDLSHSPLFQVMFTFQMLPPATPAAAGGPATGSPYRTLALTPFGFEIRTAQFDLNFLLADGPEGIAGDLEYRSDLFDAPTVLRLARQLERLLAAIAADPERAVSALPLLDEAERRQLLFGWNRLDAAFESGRPLHRLFEAAAARSPEAEAVSCDGARLSYGELEQKANRLARRLRRLGVGPEILVGLCAERSLDLIVGLLGILKAGGAYVPLDPDVPSERLSFILEDSGIRVLVTQEALAGRMPPGVSVVLLDGGADEHEGAGPLPGGAESASTAYVIYTSGSTGRPKGVPVTHANAARLLSATQPWYGFGPDDVWTLFHSFAFDFSVWEIWGALAYGGRLVVVPYWVSRSPEAFYEMLVDERVTVLNQTPSAFRQLIHAEAAQRAAGARRELALRWVVFGGEALDLASLTPWFERHGDEAPRLVNMYGITETTVHVTYRPISRQDVAGIAARGSVLGEPIPDLQVYVLDRHLEPQPLLAPGEMLVGGTGVARGYLGRPELTAERFIPDPFSSHPGSRLYRSGDLARRRPDGDLEYLGRVDHQIKVRGFRIEPAEIQAALIAHPAVREAAVIARSDGGEKRLIAYVVPASPELSISDLRRFAQESLPDYMVPAVFMALDALPLTANGKLDRRALPAPDASQAQAEQAYAPPETPAEKALAAVWAEVLGLEWVGADDNFFALGGDSILSLRVLARAREAGYDLNLQQLFQQQTVRDLAREAESGNSSGPAASSEPFDLVPPADRALLPEGLEDAYPLGRLQTGMLFHSEYNPETAVYHDVLSERLRGPFEEEPLRRAIAAVVRRHPVLRTAFALRSFSEPLQLVHREAPVPLAVDDLRALEPEARDRQVAAWLDAERHSGFDWSRPPLVRFHIHRLADDIFQHSLSFHHSVLDGWSAASMLTEIFRRYMADVQGAPLPEEPPAAALFRDFVRLEREALASPETREFWRRLMAGATPARLPRWPVPPVEQPRAHDFFVPVSPALTAGLKQAARAAGVPLKSVLCAAHLRVIATATGDPDVLTGLVVNGRSEEPGGDEVMGLFLNTLPMRLRLGDETWTGLARAAFELERDMLPHRRFPLGEIQAGFGGQPLFETAFGITHFHVYEGMSDFSGMESLADYGYEETNFPLGVNFQLDISGSRIDLRLNFSDAELDPRQVDAIRGYYARALEDLAADPTRRHAEAPLLSAEERRQLLSEWPERGPAEPRGPVHRRFEHQARETPEAVALAGEDSLLTYGELDRRANQVARALQMWGVGPDVRVGLCLDRAPSLVVALLAIWKAGGAYVPIDPSYPPERLMFLLEDSQTAVLVTEERLLAELPSQVDRVPVVRLDADGWMIDSQSEEPLPEACDVGDAENLAYVIYTSGSTGTPKGVLVPHGGLPNLAAAQIAVLDVRKGDRVLQFASPSFDASVSEILMALLAGAELHLASPERLMPGPGLPRLLAERRITHLTLPPPALAALLEDELPDLRTVVVAGESCPPELARRWRDGRPGRRLVNAYGPTENSVCVAMTAMTGDDRLPLGPPLPGLRALVLDRRLEPVPAGVPGEICAGGALARGYLGLPGLTAEKFIPDPFSELPGKRLYRTGDLGRWLPDGTLEFLGRIDHQVKVRGFRIELGEIEAALARHTEVEGVTAIARSEGAHPLVAYVVPRGRTAAEARETLPGELRTFLRGWLPEYMVPSAVVLLDALPLGPTGKVDRRRLPDPDRAYQGTEREYLAPRSETEELLAQIWSEVLGVERVSLNDNFLELGGHSLLAMQLILRVRSALGVELPLRVLYGANTLADMAVAVATAQAEALDADLLAELLDEVEQIEP